MGVSGRTLNEERRLGGVGRAGGSLVTPSTKRGDLKVLRGTEGSMGAPKTKSGNFELLRGTEGTMVAPRIKKVT